MSTEQDSSDFRELCDAVFDDRATHEQVRQLEELVLSSPDLKRLYVELVHQHASLSWSVVEGEPLDAPPEPVGDASSIPIVGFNAEGQSSQTSRRTYWPLAAIAMAEGNASSQSMASGNVRLYVDFAISSILNALSTGDGI